MLNAIKMQQPVIYFDGVCNLCNGWIDWVLKVDRANVFKFASLQGAAGQQLLNSNPELIVTIVTDDKLSNESPEIFTTIILNLKNKNLTETDAIIEILRLLPRPWSYFAPILSGLPKALRNAAYRYVSRNRYHFFGTRNTCRIPTAFEKTKFLD
ncbi:MAG: DCC1-like thiol-disulfide oxidoreductase family protein [Bdellovibrionales bacterium]